MFPPVNPKAIIIDLTLEAWMNAPGTFSKRECYRGNFLMARLIDRADVTITHCHLDVHDRPNLVLHLTGSEEVTVFIGVGRGESSALIKAKSQAALAPGLELVRSCFVQIEAA